MQASRVPLTPVSDGFAEWPAPRLPTGQIHICGKGNRRSRPLSRFGAVDIPTQFSVLLNILRDRTSYNLIRRHGFRTVGRFTRGTLAGKRESTTLISPFRHKYWTRSLAVYSTRFLVVNDARSFISMRAEQGPQFSPSDSSPMAQDNIASNDSKAIMLNDNQNHIEMAPQATASQADYR